MTPGPGWRKCTAYRRPGPGGMPLGLALTEGLDHALPGDLCSDTEDATAEPTIARMALAPLHTASLAKESDFVFVFMYSATGYACAGQWESGLTLR